MEIDDRFPTNLPSVQDAPKPFRGALADSISPQESIRLLTHAPAFSTLGERTIPTVLAVTDKGWLLVSETEDGGAHVEKAAFCDTLILNSHRFFFRANLKSILPRSAHRTRQPRRSTRWKRVFIVRKLTLFWTASIRIRPALSTQRLAVVGCNLVVGYFRWL